MFNKGMILGDQPEDINASELDGVMKIAGPIFEVLGAVTPIISGGKAKAEKVRQALKPYNELSDLVGVKIAQKITDTGQFLIPVIFGDDTRSKEINERFDLFMEFAPSVANLGIRINFQNAGLYLFPLIVFFDKQIYSKRAPKVLAHGWQQNFWKKTYLRACTINVAEKKLDWADMKGLSKSAGQAWEKLGVKGAFKKFQPEDLQLVIQLATKLMKQDFRPGR